MAVNGLRFFTVATGAALGSLQSGAAQPLQPTSKWQVEYGESQCVAMRNYATKEKPLLLVLKPSPGGTTMRVVIIQKGDREAHQLSGKVRFGSAPEERMDMLSYGASNGKMRLVSLNVPMDQFRARAAMSDFAVQSTDENGDFAVDDLPNVIAELDKCAEDLRQYWHIGETAKGNGVASAPVKPLHDLFSPDDYPGEAVNEVLQGTVTMTFLVDDKGKVADCSVDETSGVPVLDTMSCYIIQNRARFTPAIGPDGKPRRSSYTQRVTWRMR